MLIILSIQNIALCVLGSFVALYLGFCLFYFLFQERLIFVPWNGKYRSANLNLGFDFDELFLDAPDGGRIHMIRIKSAVSRGAIIYFHGNTGNIQRWAPMAKELSTYGFDVYLPDYRGYGQSIGKRTQAMLYKDTLLIYTEVAQHYVAGKICIYGRSLGSAMSTWLAANRPNSALVLETPFYSLVDVAERHLKIVPVRLFLRFQFRNDLYINKVDSPILIVHGTKDKLVPYKSALALFNSVRDRGKVRMITIPGGKHGNLNGYPLMTKSLDEFFNKTFGSIPK